MNPELPSNSDNSMTLFDADKQNRQDNETAAGGGPCYKVLLRSKPRSHSKLD